MRKKNLPVIENCSVVCALVKMHVLGAKARVAMQENNNMGTSGSTGYKGNLNIFPKW